MYLKQLISSADNIQKKQSPKHNRRKICIEDALQQ